MTELGPYRATGLASWYGKRYHGKATASGEIYDMYAMTAAHPTLPIPSYVRVTSLRTGHVVVVRVNDRGPFHSDRLIDLSYVAAYKLGILANGSAMVEVESILPGEAAPAVTASQASCEPSSATGVGARHARACTGPDRPARWRLRPARCVQPAGECHELARPAAGRGSAGSPSLAGIYETGGVYRVQAGPYANREDALQAAARIEQALDVKPVVISR